MKEIPNDRVVRIDGSIDTEKAMEAGKNARTAAIEAFVTHFAHFITVARRQFVEA